ncbi:TlpA disulfide reductase family protein [Tamlana crocina]
MQLIKLINITAIVFFSLLWSAQITTAEAVASTKNSFVINGELKNLSKDIWVHLSVKGTKSPIDSVKTHQGKFVFKGRVETPSLYTLTFLRNKKKKNSRPPYQPSFQLFLENSNISLQADLNLLPNSYSELYKNPLAYKTVKVSGSKSHDQFMDFKNTQDILDQKRSNLFMDKYIAYLNPKDGAVKGSISEGISIVQEIDAAASKAKENIITFISKNKNNYVGLAVAKNRLNKFNFNEIETIINNFSSEIKESQAFANFKTEATRVMASAKGAKFIDFNFKDHHGNLVKLSDHVGKGKYVLLEFWASWCGPCRTDIPHLKEAYKAYHPSGFEVISISMDESKEKWLEAIKEEKMSWLQVSDLKAFDGELNKLYNFQGIPTCILIDPSGYIVTRNMRGSWMDAKLIELYGNKFNK